VKCPLHAAAFRVNRPGRENILNPENMKTRTTLRVVISAGALFLGASSVLTTAAFAGVSDSSGIAATSALLKYEPGVYIVTIKKEYRGARAFPERLFALERALSAGGGKIINRLLSDEDLYLVVETSAAGFPSGALKNPLVSEVFSQAAANLKLRPVGQVEVIDGSVVPPADQLRGIDRLRRRFPANFDMPHMPGELIVTFADDALRSEVEEQAARSRAADAHRRAGARAVELLASKNGRRTEKVWVQPTASRQALMAAIAEYQQNDDVLIAELNYLVERRAQPNDPMYNQQWSLPKINAPSAWDVRTSASSTTVAVFDTGLLTTHPDLQANLWVNPGEVLDGLDNDGNGYVDDIHGFNASTLSGSTITSNFHGTQVAGIIGARGNNSLGVSGVAWEARLMGIQIFGSNEMASHANILRAAQYAAAKGASVVNASWGYYSGSSALYDAMVTLRNAGIAIVMAADNNPTDMDGTSDYPSWYGLSNMLTVTATDSGDNRAAFAQQGRWMVDLGAPGVNVVSTTGGNGYASSLNGTSFAAPHVTGAYALARAHWPQESMGDLLDRIRFSVDAVAGLSNATATGGRLNLQKVYTQRPRLKNLSTRCEVRTGAEIAIAGFVVSGNSSKQLVIRALGPSLSAHGVSGALGNPKIQLKNASGTTIAQNDDWTSLSTGDKTVLQSHGLTPGNSLEAALVVNLSPGSYTVHLEGVAGTGIALIESYDITSTVNRRMINVSTRCYVGTGQSVAIGGFIIDGDKPRRVLIRALGPSLANWGVPSPLANPTLELHSSSGLIDSNDNWRTYDGPNAGLERRLSGMGLAPANDLEAAIVRILPPGSYTAVLKGVSGGTGIGIIEVFEF
jgi:thermitase